MALDHADLVYLVGNYMSRGHKIKSKVCMTSFASEKNFMQITGCTLNVPVGGIRCSLNIPGHPIMKWKKPQLPMIIFLIIFKIQLYLSFVYSFSETSPEKCLIQT